jgi:L-2-amino-thiazoline-4-carboxylic acid hydrolase
MSDIVDLEGTAKFFWQRWRAPIEAALVAEDPNINSATTMSAIETQYMALVPKMADPGLLAPLLRVFVLNGAIYIAMFLALSPLGYTPARVWLLCDKATRGFCAAFGAVGSALVTDGMFSPFMIDYLQWEGGHTQQAPMGHWVYAYVTTDEQLFDYGVDFKRCALRELAHNVGADSFAPYVCLGDIPLSEAFGLGLHRTETLAQGGARCDFRFKRGAATYVKQRLPVVAG